jgi:SAM-dependent methyltransferase
MEISPSLLACRACGGQNLKLVLALGKTPLANALLIAEQLSQPEMAFPLDVAFCPDCALVQITETVPPEVLFRDYLYFSSFSDALLAHARKIADRFITSRKLGPQSHVLEIASNDGYLLQYFQQAGIPVLGVEPATNIAHVAEEKGIRTLNEFFSSALARKLRERGERADVIIGNNVLAHVADLNGFVRGVALVLKDSGVAQFEVPYVKDLIDHCEFDTIYHEHLCYYSLTALDRLFQRHGLRVVDVERVPIHGGSLRVQWVLTDSKQPASAAVANLLREEAAWGVDRFQFYTDFARRVEKLGNDLRALLGDLKRQGKRIAAYGAAAKGSTLLNCFRIGRETIDFVVDRNTNKQGHFMPGVRIPIYAPEELLKRRPDYALLLTWNFADEILRQQAEYRKQGGKFIVPVPEPKVV